MSGQLYIVATPIGNLDDITLRAVATLKNVDLIAAEDTRHAARLLDHYQITTPSTALHDHNENLRVTTLIHQLHAGKNIALISDAGTPLISDPGYRLVKAAHEAHIKVVTIPGACAAISALSVSGLASDRFCFEGFLPAKSTARQAALGALVHEPRTLIFYEAPHRIVSCLTDCVAIFGANRLATLARELTKTFETVKKASLAELLEFVTQDTNQQKGEIALVIEGAQEDALHLGAQRTDDLLQTLLAHLPIKTTAQLAADLTGQKKNELYQRALALKALQD